MDLDELERLHREATPGPWRCVEHSYGGCKVTNEEGDAILLEDDFRLIAAMRNALPKLISRARLYEQMDRHACDQVAEIDRLRVRIAEADRDRDTWATSAHKIANERDAAARNLAAVTVERDGLKKDLFEARNALLREGMERDAARAEGIGTMDLDELERLRVAARIREGAQLHPGQAGQVGIVQYDGDDITLFAAALSDKARIDFLCAAANALPALLQAARDLAAVTAERDALKKHYDEAAPEHNLLALLDMYHEQERTAVAERDAECERLEGLRRRDNASMRARLAEVERERDAAKQLIASLEERISDVEDRDDDARMVCEWAATVAAGGTDVRAAARRYLMGEKPPRLAALESLAEDARTCAEWCKHMDVGSGAETGAAARRVLAGIGGK